MIAYLSLGEQPSGIYSGQVIDTCKYLSELNAGPIRLFAFISLRKFFATRKALKKQYKYVVVLPMFPKLKYWRFNIILLACAVIRYRCTSIICRNSIPTRLSLFLRKTGLVYKVIYDGRGLEYEQIKEYQVLTDEKLAKEIYKSEKQAVLKSDFRLAVSSALVTYWIKNFSFKGDNCLIIPCTLNSTYTDENKREITRQSIGCLDDDCILVYAGSISAWQSFKIIFDFIKGQLDANQIIKVLLLTKKMDEIENLKRQYPGRMIQIWSAEQDVTSYLKLADYGLLIRENTVTNSVASPVKFAEYLNAGLNVIISPVLKDFTEFVKAHACGIILENTPINLQKISASARAHSLALSNNYLNKRSEIITAKYKELLKHC